MLFDSATAPVSSNCGASTGLARRRTETLTSAALWMAMSAVVAGQPVGSGGPVRTITLREVLRTATTNNPLVEAALARVRATAGSRRAAGSLPNPTFTYQVENAAYPGRESPADLEKETSTFATFPLEFVYQRGPRMSRAEAEMRAAEAALDRARWSLVLDAGRAYYRLALAQLALETTSEVRRTLGELERYNRARASEGVSSEGDAIRARVELDRALMEESLDGIELRKAQAELAPFLGLAPGGPAVPGIVLTIDPAAPESIPIPSRAQILDEARMRHPDVREARARLEVARFETSYQQSLGIRQLGLTFGNKRTAGANSLIAGFTLPVPLLDRNRGEIERAGAEREAREMELVWTERTVAARVAAAYDSFQTLSPPGGSAGAQILERAEEARKIALAAYKEGAASLLQVLDATRAVGETRRVYYRTLIARAENLLELRTVAAGGITALLDDQNIPEPSTEEKR